jgi:Protein of unknown function (DUF1254)
MGTMQAAIMHEPGDPEVRKIESHPIPVSFRTIGCVLLATIGYAAFAQAQSIPQAPAGNAVPVTADNFNRAKTDMYFGKRVKKGDRIGNLSHIRELYLTDSPVVRPNRDTLYSGSVFDLDAGPVTVTLPDAGNRFMSMQVIDEDQYTHAVYYGAGRYTITREEMGTRYSSLVIRILANPKDPEDMKQVHALQDAIKVEQKNSGKYEAPNFDPVSQKKVRDALLVLGTTIPNTKRMFGTPTEVDPVRHLIGSAMLWGGLPEKRRPLSQHHARQQRRCRRLQAQRPGRTRRRLLVNDRLQRQGLLGTKPIQCLFAEQHHSRQKRGRLGRCSVRRLQRHDFQLLADYARLELHGAALSPARRSPKWLMEIPAGAARELTSVANIAMSARAEQWPFASDV